MSHPAPIVPAPLSSPNPPLVVDLDGTLLRSDLLIESFFAFVRHHPLKAPLPLLWLGGGKARLKSRLALATPMDVATLPYDPRVVAFLEEEKSTGRRLVLATASHRHYADQIAEHLGLFDDVLATEGEVNLSARAKRDALVGKYGEQGYDYLGNSKDDLAVWASAREAHLANPEAGVEAKAARLGNVARVFPAEGGRLRAWAKQLRLHQWLKNMLIFVPLLAAHRLLDFDLLGLGVLAFFLFGLCASSVYLLNDLLDLEHDRQHSGKRRRPLASGRVPIKSALFACPALLLAAFTGAGLFLPWQFTLVLAAYFALTLAYSLVLKRLMTLDVIVLAMLYTTRLIAGGYAFGIPLSFWLLAFSMFLFLSLALVKRYTELRESRVKGKTERTQGRGYYPSDLELISSLGAASGYLSVMVLALYVQDPATQMLYRDSRIIWLACPMLLYWITRTWMIAHRGWMHDDPVIFAIKDRNSLILGVLFATVFFLAA